MITQSIFGTIRSAIFVAMLSTVAAAGTSGIAYSEEQHCPVTATVDTLSEMWAALYACWQPPAGSEGLEITLRFSLRRNGTMIGQPRVSWSKLGGDQTLQRAFVASILEALDKALPLPLSNGMGGAIAGRPMALRFSAVRKMPETSL
jgi:hypothetical protein